MKNYVISRVNGAPDWDKIPALQVESVHWTPKTDIRMMQQVGYDENGLYIHQRAWEKDVRAEHTEPLSSVCEDSCMEFFFSLEPDDGRYFNFEFNLNGCLFLGIGHGRHDGVRLIPGAHKELFQVRTAGRFSTRSRSASSGFSIRAVRWSRAASSAQTVTSAGTKPCSRTI